MWKDCNAGVLNAQNFKYENNDQVSIAVIPTGNQALLKACIHSFTNTSAASKYLKSSATCTSEAVYYKSCACGLASSTETFTSGAINSENHALVHHEAKAPTCTEVGWEAYDTCSRCDYTSKEIKPKLNHAFVDTWEHDDDKHWHKCTRDGCTGIDAEASHNWKDATTSAPKTCTVCGATTGTKLSTHYYYSSQDGGYARLSQSG